MRSIALCLLAFTIVAPAAPPAGPPELEKLRASYKAAVARGTKPAVQAHITNLEKLRDIYSRGANLAGATKVQTDIDRAKVAMSTGEFLPSAADSDAPAPELDKLRAGHEADIERATKTYRETYVRELDKLRDNYTRAANLPAAMAVQTEIDQIKSGESPKPTAEELVASGKQPRLGKAPKSEWFVGKTWVAKKSGAEWIFAKGGKGEVNYPSRNKRTPMTWEVLPTGMIKMRHEQSFTTNIISDWMFIMSATDGLAGLREEALDQVVYPKQ